MSNKSTKSSISFNIDLDPKSILNIFKNIETIKDNILTITKKIKEYDLSKLNEELNDFSDWLKQFNDEKKEKNEKDYKTYNRYINKINEKFSSLSKHNKNILKKIEKSQEILNKINLIFDPSESSIENIDANVNTLDSLYDNNENNKFDLTYLENDFYKNTKSIKTDDSTKSLDESKPNNNIIKLAIKDYKEEFIKNFSQVLKVLVLKSNILANSSNISEFPVIDDTNDVQKILEFFQKVCDLSNNSISYENNSKYSEFLNTSIRDCLKDILVFEENKGYNHNNAKDIKYFDDQYESSEGEENEAYIVDNFKFDEVKKKLFYFINIISRENAFYNKENLNTISKNIAECLKIDKNYVFLIQNSQINNYVKSYNLDEIPLQQIEIYPIFSGIKKLFLLKKNLLIEKYKINKYCFDNRGNFLNPNTRKNLFRGKEIYDPPYGWMGLGLNVLGKYQDDKWLEDITDKSEWAVAYRGIFSKNEDKMKDLIKYFIEKLNLKIAETTIKGQIRNKRRWKSIKNGVYMTPYIKIAEKYTQSISFNNKKYKVLLMAKVKINQIVEPEGSNFWILDNDDIRIYRILFKEV